MNGFYVLSIVLSLVTAMLAFITTIAAVKVFSESQKKVRRRLDLVEYTCQKTADKLDRFISIDLRILKAKAEERENKVVSVKSELRKLAAEGAAVRRIIRCDHPVSALHRGVADSDMPALFRDAPDADSEAFGRPAILCGKCGATVKSFSNEEDADKAFFVIMQNRLKGLADEKKCFKEKLDKSTRKLKEEV